MENPKERVKYVRSIMDIDDALEVLNEQDRLALQIEVDRYKIDSSFKGLYPFQRKAVESACAGGIGRWCGEASTGSGKTTVATHIVRVFKKRKKCKTIFVCHSSMAIGDFFGGIIGEFRAIFDFYGESIELGELNNISPINDVYFLTPHKIASIKTNMPKVYAHLRKQVGLIIVDEAHHYPSDNDRLKIFGQINKITRDFTNARIVTLTATHGRMDGGLPLGCAYDDVDWRYTLQDGVNDGFNPEIFGIQVWLDTKIERCVCGSNGIFSLRFKDYNKYVSLVVGVMVHIYKRYPNETSCAFVHTIRDAEVICAAFNKATGLGDHGLVPLTKKTRIKDRLRFVDEIKKGKKLGYVTCSVGEEAINIPKVSIIYQIRKTKSINRQMQGIGRGTRNHPGKRRTLVVDFCFTHATVMRAASGLADFAAAAGSKQKVFSARRPIVSSPNNYKDGVEPSTNCLTFSEEKEWVISQGQRKFSDQEKTKWLMKMIELGLPRPSAAMSRRWHELRKERRA